MCASHGANMLRRVKVDCLGNRFVTIFPSALLTAYLVGNRRAPTYSHE